MGSSKNESSDKIKDAGSEADPGKILRTDGDLGITTDSLARKVYHLIRKSPSEIFSIFITLAITGFIFWKLADLLQFDFRNTWDGTGHWVLFGIYRDLAERYLAEGYTQDWFGGFAAFRYYAPFFYFLADWFHGIGLDLPSSFDWAVLLSLFLYYFGYYYFTRFFLPTHLSLAALLFYLAFQGDSQVSTSLNGLKEGNYGSVLGMGFLYLSLGSFFRWESSYLKTGYSRYWIMHFLTASLLCYSHFLGFVFYYFTLSFYFLWKAKGTILLPSNSNFKSESKSKSKSESDSKSEFQSEDSKTKSIQSPYRIRIQWALLYFLPLLVALPSLWGPLFQIQESLGEALILHFPFLKNLVGNVDSQGLLKVILFTPYTALGLIPLIGLILSIRNHRNHFFFFLFLVFYSLIHDISWIYFLPETKIHFYRLWDLMMGIFFFLGVKGVWEWKPHRNTRYALLFFACIGFLFYKLDLPEPSFDPMTEAKLVEYIHKNIKPDNFVLMETTTGGLWKRHPHRELELLRQAGAKSLNGLIVESGWTPYVNRLYLPMRHRNDFQWGFLDPIQVFNLPKPTPELSTRYLRERNIQFLLTKNKSFESNFDFLKTNKTTIDYYTLISSTNPSSGAINNNSTVIRGRSQVNERPRKVIGLVSLETTLNDSPPRSPEHFFIESYLMQLSQSHSKTHSETNFYQADDDSASNREVEYIDLDPHWKNRGSHFTKGVLDEVHIYDHTEHRIVTKILPERMEAFGIPNKDPITKGVIPCKRFTIKKSYTLQLSEQNESPLFRNQYNQIYTCVAEGRVDAERKTIPRENREEEEKYITGSIEPKIYFPETLGRIKYFSMQILFYSLLSFLVFLLYRKMKLLFFS